MAKKWAGFAGMVLLTGSLIVTGFSDQIYFVVGMMTLGGIGIGMVLPCMDTRIHVVFGKMSLLLRTAISHEMKDSVYRAEKKELETAIKSLSDK